MNAAIVGLAGAELSPEEAALLGSVPPAGIILFKRNIGGTKALARLVGDIREVVPADTLLLVDQEGGRVARLGPPDWTAHPSAGAIGALWADDPAASVRVAWLTGALIGLDCKEAGFDVVCAPVLDLRSPDTTDAIGDRSYGSDPDMAVALAQAMADGLLGAGVQPVGKHAPGHGLATVDSHLGLPRLPPDADLGPEIQVFRACSSLPWMMTAHILYEGLDADRPGSLSSIVIEGVIRGAIGFGGVLVSDDLSMGALSGAPADLAAAAIEAGCDLAMNCSGRVEDSADTLHGAGPASDAVLARLGRARAMAVRSRLQLDRSVLMADRAGLLR